MASLVVNSCSPTFASTTGSAASRQKPAIPVSQLGPLPSRPSGDHNERGRQLLPAATLALVVVTQRRFCRRKRRVAAAAAAARRRARAAQSIWTSAHCFAGTAVVSQGVAIPFHGSTSSCADRSGAVDAAVAIGRDAARKSRQRLSPMERKQLRAKEIRDKVSILKGQLADRYRRERDKGSGTTKQAEEEENDQDSEAGAGGSPQDLTEEACEAQAEWAFKREYTVRTQVQGQAKVSEDARAVAAAELVGTGGAATSRQLLDAAQEFAMASEFDQVLALGEVARTRIDREQLNRQVDALLAQQLDDEALWLIAEAQEALGRLSQAVQTFAVLKDRLFDAKEQVRAERAWAAVAFKFGERLHNVRRFDDCLEVLERITETTSKSVVGSGTFEQVELNVAMTLKELGRLDEAKAMLKEIRRNTNSRKTKAQATFVLDVFGVEGPPARNEEFHKMWDANFKLPSDSYASQAQMRVGSGSVLQLTDREREWRSWASKYWEDRLKSPLYYMFLTLWVTWPFAIPVISILKKSHIELML